MKNLLLSLLLIPFFSHAASPQLITVTAPLVMSNGNISVSQTLPFQVMTLHQQTTPSSPASTNYKMYFKNDGNIYALNSLGQEYRVGDGTASPGGSSGAVQYNDSGVFGGFGDWDGTNLSVNGLLLSGATATTVPYLNGSKVLTSSAVTPTELGYVSGVTSAIQTQLNTKAPSASPTFTGTVTFSDLTATTVPYLNGSKALTSSAVTPTQLGYLSIAAGTTGTGNLVYSASPTFTGSISFSGPLLISNGSSGAPSLAFTNSSTSGIYRVGADSLGFSAAGVSIGNYTSGGAWTFGAIGGSQGHQVNGLLSIVQDSGPMLRIKDSGTIGTNADPYIEFRDTSGAVGSIGFTSAASKNMVVNNSTDTGSLVFLTNNTTVASVTSGSAWTLGATSNTATLKLNTDYVQLAPGTGSTTLMVVGLSNSTSGVAISGDSGTSAGAVMQLFGGSHASAPSEARIYRGGTSNLLAIFGNTAYSGRIGIGGANGLSATTSFGFYVDALFPSTTTVEASSIVSQVKTANSSFTVPIAIAFKADTASRGASSTITRYVDYYTAASNAGSNNAFFADNASFSGNYVLNFSSTDASKFSGPIQLAAGSAASPSLTFSADTTKGFYSSGTNYIGQAISGAIASEWTTGLWAVYGSSSTAEYAIQRSGAVGDLGLYGGGANSGRIALYGETHATKASVTEMINGGSISLSATSGGVWTAVNSFQIASGSVTVPGLAFSADADGSGSGIYRVGANSLGFSANGTSVGNYTSGGLWTLGPTSSTAVNVINGAVALGGTAGAPGVYIDNANAMPASSTYDSYGAILRTGGSGSAPFDNAGSMVYRARLSATAGRSSHLFYTGSTPTLGFSIDENQAVIIGATGGSQTQLVNGLLQVTQASGPMVRIKDTGTIGTNADPYIEFRDTVGAIGSIGYTSAVSKNLAINNSTDTGSVVFLTNNTTVGSATSASAWTLGATSNTATLKLNTDYIQLTPGTGSTTLMNIGLANSTSGVAISGDTGTGSGGEIRYYGGSHATLPNQVRLLGAGTVIGAFNATDNMARFGVAASGALSATTAYGVYSDALFPNTTTTLAAAFSANLRTANASFTNAVGVGFYVEAFTKGASSTITRAVGVLSGVPTAGGTGNAAFADSTSNLGASYFLYQNGTDTSRLNGSLSVGGALSTAGYVFSVVGSPASGTLQVGVGAEHLVTTAATAYNIGVYSRPTSPNSSFTTGAVVDVYADGMGKGASNTVTRFINFFANPSSSFSTNSAMFSDDLAYTGNWGIYIATQRLHLLAGNVAIGQSSAVSTTNHALRVRNDSLTGNTQLHQIRTDGVFGSAGTDFGIGIMSDTTTANSSFTMAKLWQFYAAYTAKGASSTVTTRIQYGGIKPSDGTNKAFINDEGTSPAMSGSYFIYSVDTNPTLLSGELNLNTVGKGLSVKEGSNARMGKSTLVGGTVVVSTTAVTANSRIFLTAQNNGGVPGAVSVSGRTAATSFTITSTSVADTSDIAWFIVEPL